MSLPLALPELAAIYFSQWDPDHVGRGDCVPTCAKMLLRYYTGDEVPIGQLRDEMDLGPDGVRNLPRDAGVTLDACRIVLGLHGIGAIAVWSRDLSFDRLLSYVESGRPPIIFELHGRLSRRMDQSFGGLHAVWLSAVTSGMVDVRDPDRWGPHKADRWLVPIPELRDAWDAGAALGGGAVIPNEPRKGWDDDMAFTDDDRRKLNEIWEQFSPGADGLTIYDSLKLALRRIARGLGGKRDPWVAYPDDDTPIT